MASHWPVIVGINQYELLQPLMYAQFDALELRDFLINEVGLPAEGSVLLTDVSAMMYEGAAAPTRQVLFQRLAQSCDRAGPEDTVWFFFSGYGVRWQGKDYLLPIDADPNRIEQTGLLVETLLNRLRQGNQRQSIVMLDMNRPQSALAPDPDGPGLGAQSLAVAAELEIPLVLSCRPDQFSQETLAVRHGLFTEALIEGMRFHGCLTLAQIVAYLGDRVPELCQHHWRPEQNPVAAIPPGQQYAMLVPPSLVGQMPVGQRPLDQLPETDLAPILPLDSLALEGGDQGPLPEEMDPYYTAGPTPTPSDEVPVALAESVAEPPIAPPMPPAQQPAIAPAASGPGAVPWGRWLLLGAGLLLLGVLWRNLDSLLGRPPAPEASQPGEVLPDEPSPSEPSPSEVGTPPVPPPATAPDPVGEALFPGTAVSGAEALTRARAALEERQYGEALGWLRQIPEGEWPPDYQALVNQAEVGYANATLSGNSALDEARRLIEPTSASLFSDAIDLARQVPEGDPAYVQAQADMARWSQVILDLAEGRAASGDLEGAVAAARLVPEDQPEVWGKAQTQTRQWEQRRVNQRLLQEAQSVLQPDQAGSFQAAIAVAQQIPPGYPESAVAQERIDQWSRDILAIARARAAAGQIPGAISAAGLVPPETAAYAQAQDEIRQWQGQ
jgi:hypothetical protein